MEVKLVNVVSAQMKFLFTDSFDLIMMMPIRVLLAEDEPRVQQFIRSGLSQIGISVDSIDSVDQLELALMSSSYDVLVLDRLLKSKDALFALPMIRKKIPLQKVLILSALSDVSEKIQGLDYGADDYLGKPFRMEELIARIRTLARRNEEGAVIPPTSRVLEVGDLKIYFDSQRVTRANQSIDLTLKEFKLLAVLANQPTKLFSRAELLTRAWNIDFDPSSNVVDVTMGRIRRKINLEDLYL